MKIKSWLFIESATEKMFTIRFFKMVKTQGFANIAIVIAVLIIAAIIGGGSYFLTTKKSAVSPTPPPQPTTTSTVTSTSEIDTSSWQTYRNEKYGFEFKTPANWIVEKVSDSSFRLTKSTDRNIPFWWEYRIEATKGYDNFKYYNTTSGKWGYLNLENNYFVEAKKYMTTQTGAPVYLLSVGFIPTPVFIIPFSIETVLSITAGGDFLGPEQFKDFLSTFKFIEPKN